MRSRLGGVRCACAILICLVALCTSVSPAFAQGGATGALTGTVTDPSGAVISGATVTVTSLATGQQRVVTTDANGSYTFSLLPSGNYKVRFDASGFKTIEIPSVAVNVTDWPKTDGVADGARLVVVFVVTAWEMTEDVLAQAREKMRANGIVDGGDAHTLGIGAMTDARWAEFYRSAYVPAEHPQGLDYHAAFSLDLLPKPPVK